MNTASPLRYPGGKGMLADLFGQLIEINDIRNCCFVEPFAGGAGAALTLLVNEYVDRIVINDVDPAIYAFWDSALNDTDRFVERITKTPVTIPQWKKQREVYRLQRQRPSFELGFAAFFLNRCNRSGIINNGGVIGGLDQKGEWGVDARFNRERMAERVMQLGELRERIAISSMDGLELLKLAGSWNQNSDFENVFCFIDPPYIEKGKSLYWNQMQEEEHRQLAEFLCQESGLTWVVTYDDCELVREMYFDCEVRPFKIGYSAREHRMGAELFATSDGLLLPDSQSSMRMVW